MNKIYIFGIILIILIVILILLCINDNYLEPFSEKNLPLAINVGLPRTGTQSFDEFLTKNGYECAHIGYGENDTIELNKFKQTGKGKIYDFMCDYQICGDSPYYGLIDTFKKHYPNIKLIATHRDKESWLKSMNKHKSAGGTFLRNYYGNNKSLSAIYDTHYNLCKKHNIPLVSLNDDDATKINIISNLLEDSNIQNNETYTSIDGYNKKKVKNSVKNKLIYL
jgi:hypothetical protein